MLSFFRIAFFLLYIFQPFINKPHQKLNYSQNEWENDICHLSLKALNVLKRIILTGKLIFLICRP